MDPKTCKHSNLQIESKVTETTSNIAARFEGIPFAKYHVPNILILQCPDCKTFLTYHLNAIWWSTSK